MKRWIAILFILILSGCVSTPVSPEIQAYDEIVRAQPRNFTIPTSEAEEAWSRAQQFIGTYSGYKIQVATDYVIQTYTGNSGVRYGYGVTRLLSGDTTTFDVKGFSSSSLLDGHARYNAHILAYYMRTGELMADQLNR